MGEIPKRPWHAGEDGAAIFDADGHRILDLGRRNAHLAQLIVEAVNNASRAFCMWCGATTLENRLEDPDGAATKVIEHLLACEKHPLRKVEARVLEEADRADAAEAQVATLTQERDEARAALAWVRDVLSAAFPGPLDATKVKNLRDAVLAALASDSSTPRHEWCPDCGQPRRPGEACGFCDANRCKKCGAFWGRVGGRIDGALIPQSTHACPVPARGGSGG